jgi:hypothetical protein
MTSTPKGSSRLGVAGGPGSPSGNGPPGARRKRPGPPVIDVTATEVTAEPAAAPAAPAAQPEASRVDPEPAAAPPQPQAAPPDPPAMAESTRPPRDMPLPEASPAATRIEDAELAAAPPLDREAPLEPPGREREAPLGLEAPPEGEAGPSPVPPPPPPPPLPEAERPAALARDWTVVGVVTALTVLLIVAGLWLLAAFERSEVAKVAQRLARIESQQAQLGERSASPIADLTGRMTAIERAIERAEQALAPLTTTEPAQRLAELDRRIAGAEQAVGQLDGLTARLGRLEAAPPAPPPAAEAAAAAAAAGSDAAQKALADRLSGLEAAVTSLTERVAATAGRIDQIAAQAQAADRQATVATEQASHSRPGRAVRPAILAASLRDAVARGDPFAAELSELKSLVPDAVPAPQWAALEAFATTGVPTAAALGRELAELVPGMRAASAAPAAAPTAPSAPTGVLERLQASAERLVRIRRIDEPAPDDQAALLARIEASAARADIAAARADLARLPAGVRAPAEAWSRKAEAREAALGAAHSLARDTAAALGKE